jgi:hypothetical protein
MKIITELHYRWWFGVGSENNYHKKYIRRVYGERMAHRIQLPKRKSNRKKEESWKFSVRSDTRTGNAEFMYSN